MTLGGASFFLRNKNGGPAVGAGRKPEVRARGVHARQRPTARPAEVVGDLAARRPWINNAGRRSYYCGLTMLSTVHIMRMGVCPGARTGLSAGMHTSTRVDMRAGMRPGMRECAQACAVRSLAQACVQACAAALTVGVTPSIVGPQRYER